MRHGFIRQIQTSLKAQAKQNRQQSSSVSSNEDCTTAPSVIYSHTGRHAEQKPETVGRTTGMAHNSVNANSGMTNKTLFVNFYLCYKFIAFRRHIALQVLCKFDTLNR